MTPVGMDVLRSNRRIVRHDEELVGVEPCRYCAFVFVGAPVGTVTGGGSCCGSTALSRLSGHPSTITSGCDME